VGNTDVEDGKQSVMVNAVLVLVHLFFLMLFGRGFFQYLLVFVDIGVLTLLTCVFSSLSSVLRR
jgi:hypothetical protein